MNHQGLDSQSDCFSSAWRAPRAKRFVGTLWGKLHGRSTMLVWISQAWCINPSTVFNRCQYWEYRRDLPVYLSTWLLWGGDSPHLIDIGYLVKHECSSVMEMKCFQTHAAAILLHHRNEGAWRRRKVEFFLGCVLAKKTQLTRGQQQIHCCHCERGRETFS